MPPYKPLVRTSLGIVDKMDLEVRKKKFKQKPHQNIS